MAPASGVAFALLLASLTAAPGTAGSGTDPAWLDPLEPQDRSCLERGVGYAAPDFTQDLLWFNTQPLKWQDLRGKVVVIQSWSSTTQAGYNWARRAAQISGDNAGVVFIALHTPQGAEKAAAFLEHKAPDVPVAVDPRGAFCDQIGAYQRPVNIVVDCNGVLRYSGLNTRGLQSAVKLLLAEPDDPQAVPAARPAETESRPAAEFPPIVGSPGSATDFRGKKAPELHVQQWMTAQPKMAGKIVVVEFWATWCGPCRMSIPHMNEFAAKFGDDVVFIGLSDEDRQAFLNGMTRYRLDPDGFHYCLGLDPSGQAKKAMRVNGIPHAIVMSRDGIVRWQGHPLALDGSTLKQIVQADKAMAGGSAGQSCRRWGSG